MISREQVREEVRQALRPEGQAGLGLLKVSGEADLQALVKLIREMASNPLLAEQLQQGRGVLQVQVLAGQYEGCVCPGVLGHAESPAPSGVVKAKARMLPALGGLVTLTRLQAANLEGHSVVVLGQDAVLTPSAKDWLRQNKVQVQRGET